ncbi:MAG TPA: cupredoxin domain-containing protein [Candidatus Limnocylindrales bacterium]|nr:cupredoxin domain-containing protein [Candidatus Limnocylindrales bacterium]
MTDQDRSPEQRLPARREPSAPPSADRFSAPPSIQATGGLTPARSAQIVRQTGSARWVAFLGVSIVALFVIAYYFYETGLPFGLSQARLEAQGSAQQVTSVERGYNLFEANCARCHGAAGQGGIGPVLNDQVKLFDHLNPTYIKNVLTVGGRYVCGNASSLMPVWADTNGGPLNYIQIQDLIAFLRAPNSETYVVRDPTLNEPVIGPDGKVETFKGWVDPSFKPDPSASPFPACWSGTPGGATPAPSGPAASPSTIIGTVTAQNIAFDVKDLSAPANQPFGIDFKQQDAGVGGHNIQIKDSGGTVVFDGQVLNDPGETTYVVPALPAGTYTFQCRIHPIPAMTGTLTVK